MALDDRASSKRSRFDQADEAKRSSRFDRRSRSPGETQRPGRRSRSPSAATKPPATKPAVRPDAAAAAAAAAARINAAIQAKKGIQQADVPPIQKTASPLAVKAPPTPGPFPHLFDIKANEEADVDNGDFVKDIEVNDLRNRYTLTKGSTQKTIKEETGADVTTRGNYYPDKSMATVAHPPLYLHITSTTKEGLDQAVQKINDLMKQELPNLIDERRFRRRDPENGGDRDEFGRRKWPEERIPIDLEPIPGFNLRAQVVGHGGAYVKHIQGETRCRVQIKGRNSGFLEHNTNAESDEPMYLHVAGPDPADVQKARELCLSLLENVRGQYERFKENPPSRAGFKDGQDSAATANPYGGYGNTAPGSTSQGPPGTSAAGDSSASQDYAAQYAQYYGGQDPYAAYGGYQNYMAYYQYYQQQQQAQQSQAPGQHQSPDPNGSLAPPPPSAPTEEAPPPPPSTAPSGGYNSVPPPPGM